MPINVKIPQTRRRPAVTVKVSNTGQILSTDPVTVKTTTGEESLDQLSDVNASHKVAGGVPVYNPLTGLYEIRELDISEITGTSGSGVIDGGDF